MRIGSQSSVMSAYAEQRSARAPRAGGNPAEETTEAPLAAKPAEATPEAEPDPNLDTKSPDDTDGESPKALGGRPQLTDEQQAEVVELQRRDAEVRAHEAAHAAAAGSLGGGASFEYTTGPDGRSYAIGGEVPVRISSGRTPEETLRNAAQVRSAALAPAEPSAQDRAVAVEAAAMEAAARAEMAARGAAAARELATPERRTERTEPATDPRATDTRPASTKDAVEEHLAQGPDEVIRQLESEQRMSRAGWRHLHLETSCGSCGMAAAAYR
jgi:hypothetical protein